ncbi:MAG: hypothetical protein ACRCZO_05750 [Cetobacterium sp.]
MGDSTFGNNSPIQKGLLNIYKIENPLYLKIHEKIKEKTKIYSEHFNYLKTIITKKYCSEEIKLYTKKTKKLLLEIILEIEHYRVAIIAADATQEIEDFYSQDIFHFIDLVIDFNNLITKNSLNVITISADYFNNFHVPKKYEKKFIEYYKKI